MDFFSEFLPWVVLLDESINTSLTLLVETFKLKNRAVKRNASILDGYSIFHGRFRFPILRARLLFFLS